MEDFIEDISDKIFARITNASKSEINELLEGIENIADSLQITLDSLEEE